MQAGHNPVCASTQPTDDPLPQLSPCCTCSAILNALLTLLNERLFDNGNQRLPVPLLCLVGASNELPESEELDALYDRFLIRRTVNQVCLKETVRVFAHLYACCTAPLNRPGLGLAAALGVSSIVRV